MIKIKDKTNSDIFILMFENIYRLFIKSTDLKAFFFLNISNSNSLIDIFMYELLFLL